MSTGWKKQQKQTKQINKQANNNNTPQENKPNPSEFIFLIEPFNDFRIHIVCFFTVFLNVIIELDSLILLWHPNVTDVL